MDESAASWRALEDQPAASQRHRDHANHSGRPAPWAIAILVVAVTLGSLAFVLAASANSGSVGVEGARVAVGAATDDPATSRGPAGSGIAPADAQLVVDVQGAVVRPGVVRLTAGSRVGDAIAAAGGFGPRVAAERVGRALNLAALLRDGDQVVVPSRDDVAVPGSGGSSGPSTGPGPVDLNRASASELDALPGIGPVTANKIIAARDEQRFGAVDDLRSRKIVGAATFDKIKDLVVVR
jgi:competence protein ComEA